MRNKEFNKVFMEVVMHNCNSLSFVVQKSAENFVLVQDMPVDTENEVREMAVRFFNAEIAKDLAERTSRQINTL